MAFCAELHWKRAGLTEEKLFIILLLTVVFTELLVNRLVRRCQCSGAHLVRIQAGIWKMNGADCTNLLPFFFLQLRKAVNLSIARFLVGWDAMSATNPVVLFLGQGRA